MTFSIKNLYAILTIAFLAMSANGNSAWYDSDQTQPDQTNGRETDEMNQNMDGNEMAKAGEQDLKIDINPNDTANKVDLQKDKTIEVAILGSSEFDVNNIDEASLKLADVSGTGQFKILDSNQDGFSDLVAEFPTADLKLESGFTELTLSGKTKDGKDFVAKDKVFVESAHS